MLNDLKNKLSSIHTMWLFIMIVALWSILNQNTSINRDGLGYLEQATYFINGEWKKGFLFYPWPLFSFLIATIYKFTHIHLQIVAHFLCFLMFGLTVFYYLKILNMMSKNKNFIFYGGILLTSSIPIMDDYIGMILRDHGLWAGCLAGTYYFLKARQQNNYLNSLKWQTCFFISGLFRPEGFIFLLLLPLWKNFSKGFFSFTYLTKNYLLVLFILIVLFFMIIFSHNFLELFSLSRLTQIYERPIFILSQFFNPMPIQSNDSMLNILINDHIYLVGITMLLCVTFVKWFQAIGLMNFFILFYGFKNKMIINNDHIKKDIFFFASISFLIVLLNIFHVYVLSNRYWGFHLWWIYLIITPIIIQILSNKNFSNYLKVLIYLILMIQITNVLIDKKNNIELDIVRYVNENSLTGINFGEFERVSYYINYDPFTFKNYHDDNNFMYELKRDVDNVSSDRIVKKFNDPNPKFYLIRND